MIEIRILRSDHNHDFESDFEHFEEKYQEEKTIFETKYGSEALKKITSPPCQCEDVFRFFWSIPSIFEALVVDSVNYITSNQNGFDGLGFITTTTTITTNVGVGVGDDDVTESSQNKQQSMMMMMTILANNTSTTPTMP